MTLPDQAIRQFLLEWTPLRGALVPAEHLDGSLFACFHVPPLLADLGPDELRARPDVQLVLWDALGDLGEQIAESLGANWGAYQNRRATGWDPVAEHAHAIDRQRSRADEVLKETLARFNSFADGFHDEYAAQNRDKPMEHTEKGRLPRYDEWRPQRFCVHDHLMGVMGCRYDRSGDRVEVASFATRDHTSYARGTATMGLLLCLLCDWAQQRGRGGIAFVAEPRRSNAPPQPIPHEIWMYAYLLGVELDPNGSAIDADACHRLLLAVTPWSGRVRGALTGHSEQAMASLMVHRSVWKSVEVEGLVLHCPPRLWPFGEGPTEGELLRYQAGLQHWLTARLLGLADDVVRRAADEAGKPVLLAEPVTDSTDRAYARRYVCAFDLEITTVGPENTEGRLVVPAGRPIVTVSWAAAGTSVHAGLNDKIATLHRIAQAHDEHIVLVLPEQPGGVHAPSDDRVEVFVAAESIEDLTTDVARRVSQAHRARG